MFPFIRTGREFLRAMRMARLDLTEVHVSHHRCWPWDLDGFMELNNGRALTLYDFGRFGVIIRTGLGPVLRKNGWGLTMAGSTVRYRRRIRNLERFEMQSRVVFYDPRFIYVEQSMWKQDGECASHVLYRMAITDKNGIVAPEKALPDMGFEGRVLSPPDWVAAWIEAENARPWPPMQNEDPLK